MIITVCVCSRGTSQPFLLFLATLGGWTDGWMDGNKQTNKHICIVGGSFLHVYIIIIIIII